MTDGDHFAYPSSEQVGARARSFDDAPARCWLWDNGYALNADTHALFDYMDGGTAQAEACRALRQAKAGFDFPDGRGYYVCAHHSTFAQSVSDIWNANKEGHMAKDQNPRDLEQTTDGVAHLAYYDAPTQLSFTWNGSHDSTISVSHGGYAEPVFDTFEWTYGTFDLGDTNGVEAGIGLLNWFKRACQRYLSERYGVPALLDAFRAGLNDDPRSDFRAGTIDYLAFDNLHAVKAAYLSGREVRGLLAND